MDTTLSCENIKLYSTFKPLEVSVDILNVGDADGIIIWIRKYNPFDELVLVIDGGKNSKGAEKIVDTLNEQILPFTGFLNTDNLIVKRKNRPDYVICSHPDRENIIGLFNILENFKDTPLVLKTNDLVFSYNPMVDQTIFRLNFPESLIHLIEFKMFHSNIISINDENLITKLKDFDIEILGPTDEYYNQIYPKFSTLESYFSTLLNETIDCRLHLTGNDPNPFNKTSIILMLNIGNEKYLFPGDADVEAIKNIPNYYKKLQNVRFVKLPNRGSRNNLNKEIIDLLNPDIVVISATESLNHPNENIIQLFNLKKTKIFSTHEIGNIRLFKNMNDRKTGCYYEQKI
ncbi:MAG: hypothetical protein JXR48_18140 [Candidatus Delongbacteria bacterium]|nr:hypothetical protein [Candidatus Delongbacteria bacterium]MBN2836881.1 hypothetical protein [Candidatus Delongbacteria bacterium]